MERVRGKMEDDVINLYKYRILERGGEIRYGDLNRKI